MQAGHPSRVRSKTMAFDQRGQTIQPNSPFPPEADALRSSKGPGVDCSTTGRAEVFSDKHSDDRYNVDEYSVCPITEEKARRVNALWPEQCRFLDRRITDIAAIRALLDNDMEYTSTPRANSSTTSMYRPSNLAAFTYFHFNDRATTSYIPLPADGPISIHRLIGDLEARPPRQTLIFVHQKRAYTSKSSVSRMVLSRAEWAHLLAGAEVLPSFLHVLHSIDAACARHLTITPSEWKHAPEERTGRAHGAPQHQNRQLGQQ